MTRQESTFEQVAANAEGENRQIVGLANVEFPGRVLQNVDPVHRQKKNGSRGRARTCNPPVNSRLLYH